jgi:predicted oxidoreductase
MIVCILSHEQIRNLHVLNYIYLKEDNVQLVLGCILELRMKYQLLGKTSLRVSSLAYGMWRFAGTDVSTAKEKIQTALDIGINFFDQADIYGVDGGGVFGDSELLLGSVLKEVPGFREKMIIASKGGIVLGVPYDSSTEYIRSAVEGSLQRMGIECIDLYQIHRPDFFTHPQELAAVLTKLRSEGKIKEIGVSNYTPEQCSALQSYLDFPIASHQPQFSCWHLNPLRDGILDQCMHYGMTPLSWSPMGGGILGLNIEEAQEEGGDRLVSLLCILDRIATEQKVSRGAVALAWLLSHPSRPIPILGTQKTSRIRDSADAFRVNIDRKTWYEILVVAQGEALP